MIKNLILFILIAVPQCISAAGTHMHLYLTDHWVAAMELKPEDCIELYQGSVYPGIGTTHLKIEQISKEADLFEQGMLLHSFIEEKRETLIEHYGLHEFIRPYADGHEVNLLKLIEEEILYTGSYLKQRGDTFDLLGKEADSLISFEEMFQTIGEKECQGKMTLDQVKKWHQFVQLYISCPPSELSAKFAKENQSFIGVSPKTWKKWEKVIPKLAKEKRIQKYAHGMIYYFAKQFQDEWHRKRMSEL